MREDEFVTSVFAARTFRRAPIPPALLKSLLPRLAPDAEIHTPYGATEALPVASIGAREVLSETAAATARGAGTCVGLPFSGVDVRIIERTAQPIGIGRKREHWRWARSARSW